MAFVSAKCTRYENITDNITGLAVGIIIGGLIQDDLVEYTRYTEYTIKGDEFTSLPTADPILEHTPADPRYQAIETIMLSFLKRAHTEWAVELSNRPVLTPKPVDEMSQLPIITELPPDA